MKRAVLPIVAAVAAILSDDFGWRVRVPSGNRRFRLRLRLRQASSRSSREWGWSKPTLKTLTSVAPFPAGHAVVRKSRRPCRARPEAVLLDDRDLRADQQVKRSALEGAQARMAKLEQEPRAEDIPPAEERVREAQANLADAEVQVRLIESVTDKRAVRDEDVQRRRLAYKAAQARLAEVEAQLKLLKAGAWAPDIAVAKSEVAQAEAQVKMAETNTDRLTMRAPIAGVILQNKVRLGQFAACGPLSEPLMILGSVTPLHVRVDVDEHDAWRVRGGALAAASPRGNGSIRIPLGVRPFRALCDPQEVAHR